MALLVAAVIGLVMPSPSATSGPWSEPVVSHLTAPDLRLVTTGDVPVEVRPPWAEPTLDLVGRVVLYDRAGVLPLPPRDAAWVPRSTRSGAWLLVTDEEAEASTPSTASLVDRVRTARVAIDGAQGTRVCDRWLFDRWVCGPDPWLYVGATELAVRGRPWRCLWAHPSAEGPLQITFDDLPAGADLRGRYAFADAAVAQAGGAGVDFAVRAGDDVLVQTVAPFEAGHGTWRTTLPADATSVTLTVSASDLGQRHFCFDATVRTAPSSTERRVPTVPVLRRPGAGP